MKTIIEMADAYATAVAIQGEAHDHVARDALIAEIEAFATLVKAARHRAGRD